ncbi:hypothetical protein F5Y19DRAFT_432097 [Xylariaceae sp. FL1651]|nr:hypothetical protein F5Y19DRAFT_432097 [Xylariaceae sp. FL1651]
MPRPLKSSCDRCHSQKLKCPKETGNATCLRCLKAGADCVFSPAGPAWRRLSANTAYQNDPLLQQHLRVHDNIVLQSPWPSFSDIGGLSVHPLQLDGFSLPHSDPIPDATPQDPRSTCVRQLTNLAVEIHQISVEISPFTNLHLPKGSDPEELYSEHVVKISHSRCIEQLFTLAQRLIDLYPNLLRLVFDGNELHAWEKCPDPNCIHNSDTLEDLDNVFPDTDQPKGKIDTFLINLLCACHSKVSDVLEAIIRTAKLCAVVTKASLNMVHPRLHIPELRVGDFVVSATSASSMQATLLVHLASGLMENVKLLRRTVEDASSRADPFDKTRRIMLLQCDLLEERSQLQADQFVRMRDALMKHYIK